MVSSVNAGVDGDTGGEVSHGTQCTVWKSYPQVFLRYVSIFPLSSISGLHVEMSMEPVQWDSEETWATTAIWDSAIILSLIHI